MPAKRGYGRGSRRMTEGEGSRMAYTPTGDCTWELPTGVLCEAPESRHDGWEHDGITIVHPYCPPESRIAAEARAARVADVEAIVRAWHVEWLPSMGDDGYYRKWAERYIDALSGNDADPARVPG